MRTLIQVLRGAEDRDRGNRLRGSRFEHHREDEGGGYPGAKLIAINTDAQHLARVKADFRILIGRQRTRGLGAGSIPQIGEEAALENEQDIKAVVSGCDMVFIRLASAADRDRLRPGWLQKLPGKKARLRLRSSPLPFTAEGAIRAENAEAGLERLRDVTDTVIVVPNDRLLEVVPKLPLHAAFKVSD
jgi:cell division protein FtsZ